VIRLAIILLFTTGIRRGELLGLTLGDYDPRESTLLIRETKFYKSLLLPINGGLVDEINHYLRVRAHHKLPVSLETAFIWNVFRGGRAYSGTCLRHCLRPLLQKCGIRAPNGKLPRIHDFRHSFAVNALVRWYRAGADMEAKLPMLATYLGHGSAVSSHYYLHFIEPLRIAASERFANHYGQLISPSPQAKRRSR
jgi:integrase/recombinase XerD